MRENIIESNCSVTWLEDGIIIQEMNPFISEVNLEIAKRLIADRKYAAAGKPRPVCVIGNNSINIDKHASKYYKEDEPYNGIIAIALFIDNWITSVIVSIVFKFQSTQVPIETFNNKEKAIKWLEKYRKDY